MNLDFSNCHSPEDVAKVFKSSGLKRRVKMISRKYRSALEIYRFVHHVEGFVTRTEIRTLNLSGGGE